MNYIVVNDFWDELYCCERFGMNYVAVNDLG
jgi:hypothetical protein